MTYRILPTKKFTDDFRNLDVTLQKRVKKKIEKVAQDPKRYKKLHYKLTGKSRIRIGKLRILFSYNERRKEIYLEKIVFKHKY